MRRRQGHPQLLLAGLLLSLSGGCGEGDASGAGETVCLEGDETGGAMSGDDGCSFVPGCMDGGEDEGPTVKLDFPDGLGPAVAPLLPPFEQRTL